MHCEEIAVLICAKLDGELTDREAMELEQHLEVCPDCRALEAQLAALHEPLANMEELQAPESLVSGVMEKICADQANKPKVIPFFRRPQVRALTGLAACAVLCVGLMRSNVLPGNGADDTAAKASQEAVVAEASVAASVPVANTGMDDAIADGEECVELMMSAYAERANEEITPYAGDGALPGAPSHYAFANDRYLRVAYGSTPEAPSARVLGSVDSLADFLAGFPEDDLSELAAAYDEDYFRTGRILAVVLEEGSGSVRHTIAHQGVEWGTVTILRQVPEAGTCDMAAWLIVAEMDTRFEDGHTFTVIFG